MSDDYLSEQNNRLAAQQWHDNFRSENEKYESNNRSIIESILDSEFGMVIIFGLVGAVYSHFQLVDLLNTDIWWHYGLLIIGDIAGFVIGMFLIPLALVLGIVGLILLGVFHLLKYILFTLIL